jgi:hypothetical protein
LPLEQTGHWRLILIAGVRASGVPQARFAPGERKPVPRLLNMRIGVSRVCLEAQP